MEHAKKMVLVPYDSYNQPTVSNPLNEKMVLLDKEMELVLKDKMLTEMQKVNKYAKIMQEYMEYRRKKKVQGGGDSVPVDTVTPMDEKSDSNVEKSDPISVNIKDKTPTENSEGEIIKQSPKNDTAYLFIDLRPDLTDKLRIRAHILNTDHQIVYLEK